jgi:hypothetical protein
MNKTQKNNIYVKEKSMMNQGNYNIEVENYMIIHMCLSHSQKNYMLNQA